MEAIPREATREEPPRQRMKMGEVQGRKRKGRCPGKLTLSDVVVGQKVTLEFTRPARELPNREIVRSR